MDIKLKQLLSSRSDASHISLRRLSPGVEIFAEEIKKLTS